MVRWCRTHLRKPCGICAFLFWTCRVVVVPDETPTGGVRNPLFGVESNPVMVESPLATVRTAMHPHFLFNTMNAICGYAVRRDHDAVIAMLTRLSDLLRAGYSQAGEAGVPIIEEVRSLRSYLELQQLRHGSEAAVEVALDDSADGAMVAPMVVVPMVDAAIADSAGSFTAEVVRVGIRCAGDTIEVELTGNGFPGAGSGHVSHYGNIMSEGSVLRLRIPRLTAMKSALERAE
jgi:LytS/YehU family sensor histidine kinase